eukprot:IDg23650t1
MFQKEKLVLKRLNPPASATIEPAGNLKCQTLIVYVVPPTRKSEFEYSSVRHSLVLKLRAKNFTTADGDCMIEYY